jgi:hypothetical protein
VEVHKGNLTSRDMYWLMTTALELTVQALAHASSGDDGVKEQQWNVRLKASSCPPKLRKVTYLKVDSAEVVVFHNAIHVNWPCKRCYSPEHPTKFCKVSPEVMEGEQQKHTVAVPGRLPSTLGNSSRDYNAGERPRTIEALETLLRKARFKPTDAAAPAETRVKSPKKSTRGKSPRKGSPSRKSSPLTLPAEWGQTVTDTANAAGDDVEMNEEAPAEQKAEAAVTGSPEPIEGETPGSSTSSGLRDLTTDMADTDMLEEDVRPGTAEQYGAAVQVTRIQQRKERAGRKSPVRGRSPTIRPRPSTEARKRLKATFRQNSKELHRHFEASKKERAEQAETQNGHSDVPSHTRTGVLRDTTSSSPKRRAADDWPREREREEDGCEEVEYGTGSSPIQTRSLSPKRMAREARTPGGKVALQKFIHQFMTPDKGREAASPAGTTAHLPPIGESTTTEAPTESAGGTAHLPSDSQTSRAEGEDSDGCSIVKVSAVTDSGALLSEWMTVLGGDITEVAANGQCGWLAFYAALYNVKDGLTHPTGEVTAKANLLKKQILNEMLVNLMDETKLHPHDLPVEAAASGYSVEADATTEEQLRALANHYAAQRAKSVKGEVPLHFWVRPAHIKAMAMHARESVYVLDVHEDGMAWMQAYAYHDVELEKDVWIETGTVCPIPTVQALTLMADLVEGGIRPPVMVLRWSPMGNHFQAVTYNQADYDFYAEKLVQLAPRRNEILTSYGWKPMDLVAYDEIKTARAAAAALTAMRRADTVPRGRLGSTIGEAAARLR